MFTLWYSVLSWREYRDAILEKFKSTKPASNSSPSNSTQPQDNLAACPLPPKKVEPSRIPVIEPPKQPPRTPSPQPPKSPTPQPPKSPTPQPPKSPTPQPSQSPTPQPPSPQPSFSPPPQISKPQPPLSPQLQRPLEPPAKPPRSPSPHPMRTEVFDDDIEYEEEDSEAEEDDDSLVGSPAPTRRPVANSVNEFLNQEISNQQNSFDLNQR